MKKKVGRKKNILIIIFFIIGVTIIFLINNSLIERPPSTTTTTPHIATTIFPLYDIARNITGDAVIVSLLLPPGASPHTFEPSPTMLKNLYKADALYIIGHGIDDWATKLADDTKTEVIVVDDGINLTPSQKIIHDELDNHEETDEAEHEHGDVDPHYWLSIPNAITIATTIANDLKIRFPEIAPLIQFNLENYLNDLTATNQQIHKLLSAVPNREIVTLHAAWYYFAKEYDLTVVASFEPSPGKEPTPQYLTLLEHIVKQTQIKTIYSEPQISTATLEPFINDHNLDIAILDPLGGLKQRESYVALMLYNAETIVKNQ
jgi:zinc transport system substrate-binding protein